MIAIFLRLVCLILLSACDRKLEPPKSQQALRISCENDPQTLDPRQVRDLATTTPIHLLYEGLTRIQEEGQPGLALAESVHLSPDQKTYTFKLRSSAWSDGQPVTAQDFEQTWKSILDPDFPSPNAYQLYVIKGAQEAKEGQGDLKDVGIHALDDKTLVVELNYPTPYFLHLTATHFYYPVHPKVLPHKTTLEKNKAEKMATNGPFKVDAWSRHNQLIASPNPHYWDRSSIRLDQVTFIVLDHSTALQLFHNQELEWVGSPLSTLPTDALATLKQEGALHIAPAAGVYLFRFNTEESPFDQVKMRQAFALALNRQELIEHVLQGNQIPAMGLIPPSFLSTAAFFSDHAVQQARQLFQEALAEKNLTAQDELPSVSLCYATGERSHKIAQVAQQQWKDALGVDVHLQNCESKVYFDRLKSGDYQLSIGSWFADFRDPIAFLEVFKFKNNGTNNTKWENARYRDMLTLSSQAVDPLERQQLLKEAEAVLLADMPLAPLFYASYNYLKQPRVKGVYFSELGYLDFKHAYLE